MYEETITLADYPNYRFKVVQDNDASEPIADSGVNVHYYVCESAHYGSSNTEPNGEYAETFARFLELYDTDTAFTVFRRWLHIFEEWSWRKIESQTALYNHRGYTQSEWATLFVCVPDTGYGTATGWAEEWSQWARGDVFGVIVEKRIPCNSPECHGDEYSHYEELESLWGIYADSAEDAATYFASYYL